MTKTIITKQSISHFKINDKQIVIYLINGDSVCYKFKTQTEQVTIETELIKMMTTKTYTIIVKYTKCSETEEKLEFFRF